MAKHQERIILPCFNICTFAIFDRSRYSIQIRLGNASLDYEIAEVAATIPGEICIGQGNATATYSFRGQCVHASAVCSLARHSAAMTVGQRPHLSGPSRARR
jgi:hypothetical protein